MQGLDCFAFQRKNLGQASPTGLRKFVLFFFLAGILSYWARTK